MTAPLDNDPSLIGVPILDTVINAPTAAILYQFREVCILGNETRVACMAMTSPAALSSAICGLTSSSFWISALSATSLARIHGHLEIVF